MDLLDLMAYKAWANARLFAALQRMDEAALLAPQPIVFGSLLSTRRRIRSCFCASASRALPIDPALEA
jgi:hypothetical protein